MMTLANLGDLSSIRSGYTFRKVPQNSGGGEVCVLQARNISGMHLQDDVKDLIRINDSFQSKHFLKSGDVLLTSRGSFRSAVCTIGGKAIATSSMFVIRVRTEDVLPDYLCIYLNSELAQNYFRQTSKGATIASILVGDLGSLKVPLVSLDKQRQLIGLNEAIQEQRRLSQLKQNLMRRILTRATEQTMKGIMT
jgi:restriction endonuclease S subunit